MPHIYLQLPQEWRMLGELSGHGGEEDAEEGEEDNEEDDDQLSPPTSIALCYI